MKLKGYHLLPEPVGQEQFLGALEYGTEQTEGFSYSSAAQLPSLTLDREGLFMGAGDAPYDTVVAEKPMEFFDWKRRLLFSVPRRDEVDGGWVHYADNAVDFDDQYREALEDILGHTHAHLGFEKPEPVI